MSEDITWKKDEKPYLVFQCAHCKQYLYVKKSQKTKKCLRCGHMHKVSRHLTSAETIYGLSNAREMVKKRQHELALKEMKNDSEFRGLHDFTVIRKKKEKKGNEMKNENNLLERFKQMLLNIADTYKQFPDYVLEIRAEEYDIPHSELKLLTNHFIKEGFLLRLDNYIYSLSRKGS
jgi:hypothetical protein